MLTNNLFCSALVIRTQAEFDLCLTAEKCVCVFVFLIIATMLGQAFPV